MVYKHNYFTLDTESRRVFDENNKELRITGNAYRMLVFLCANKNTNLTQIGEFLDAAKDYDENSIRQYKYKINTVLGYDVVEYRNGIYSLIGEVINVEKLQDSDRNTSLLQAKEVYSGQVINATPVTAEKPTPKLNKWPAVVSAIILMLSFFSWPYGFYTLLKLVVTAAAIYYTYYLYKILARQNFWFWGFVFIAILFNPIVPVTLGDKSIWLIIDVIVAIFLLVGIFKSSKQ